jgi:uncharacterized membrane protein
VTQTAKLTRLALLIALTTTATMAVRIPVPRTGGYINMGDSVVYVAALLFGPVSGLVAGGIGSALADLLGGYGVYAPFTLIIKGLEGVLVGAVGWPVMRKARPLMWTDTALVILSVVVGGAAMIGGYFVAEAYLLHLGVGAAATEVPGNIAQVLGGLIVAVPISVALRRVVIRSGN